MINFYHANDPNCPDVMFRWTWVYLHGAAEKHSEATQQDNDWEWDAPDLFFSDTPIPSEPGQYKAMLYGKEVIAVLATANYPTNSLSIMGRVALNDPESDGYEHCFKPQEWM